MSNFSLLRFVLLSFLATTVFVSIKYSYPSMIALAPEGGYPSNGIGWLYFEIIFIAFFVFTGFCWINELKGNKKVELKVDLNDGDFSRN